MKRSEGARARATVHVAQTRVRHLRYPWTRSTPPFVSARVSSRGEALPSWVMGADDSSAYWRLSVGALYLLRGRPGSKNRLEFGSYSSALFDRMVNLGSHTQRAVSMYAQLPDAGLHLHVLTP
ncbi:hypothetical protein EVAR_52479_1 [Eumeta japonica]|uniref:Uncharacterized protein n=1 Tax=Eumeta variegata TaxID=151549 RepID=A0A4C1Z3Y0_EUMVA|nr:hypothetical protein EVAR_52479_1 [Eumeta japonica]